MIVSNSEAKRILEEKNGILVRSNGRITLNDETKNSALLDSIEKSANTSAGEELSNESLFSIERASGSPSLIGEIFPIQDSLRELDTSNRACMVTLIDPLQTQSISTKSLALSYNFTDAESDVCAYIVAGHSNPEIADIRNVSMETVKSQISKILGKTNCLRRSDLVRLACKTSPPIL